MTLFSCSKVSDSSNGAPVLTVVNDKGNIDYQGGELKLHANFGSGVQPDDIQWRIGAADIIRHGILYSDSGLILEDTLWVEWTKLPKFSLDTTIIDSLTNQIDTVFYDTLEVVTSQGRSDRYTLKIGNMNPKADTLLIQGRVEPIEFKGFKLTAHRGEILRFKIQVSDPFNPDYTPRAEWVNVPDVFLVNQTDSIYEFEWRSPTELMRDTVEIRFTDSRGAGYRSYNVTRFTYNESGSVWLTAGEKLHKVSALGDRIFSLGGDSIIGDFKEISSIAIHPNRPFVYVADRSSNDLLIFNIDGALLFKDTTNFKQPEALAIDVQSDRLWVSDRTSDGQGQLRRFDVSSSDSLISEVSIGPHVGPITSIGIDQFETDHIYFTVPEGDYVGRIRDGIQDTLFDVGYDFNRPNFISYEAADAKVWIADSSSLYQMDTTGVIIETVEGFGRITGLGSGPSGACVADGRQGQSFLFPKVLTGVTSASQGQSVDGFVLPISVSYLQSENSCWISDRELGTLFKIDQSGTILNTIPGFDQPGFVAVHQGVE